MNLSLCLSRLSRVAGWLCLVSPLPALSVPTPADWNGALAAIDAQIRAATGPTYQQGNAVNVLPGVIEARLEQKRVILVEAGFNWFAPAGAVGGYDYGNFFSFTGAAGQTDTQLRIVETTAATLLFRRGYPNEPSRRLGAWWGDGYLSPEATRDQLAVLAAWGSPLTGIYVVSVPAGTRMLAGLTSPMQADAEFRAGGAVQYWLNSRENDWLVHALHAPDYLGSYVVAMTGAQKLNRELIGGLGTQLRDTALRDDSGAAGVDNGVESWVRVSTVDTDYRPLPDGEIAARGESVLLGCGWTLAGSAATARVWAGAVVGRSTLRQRDERSGVAGRIDGNFGGLYAIYRRPSSDHFPWYVGGSVLHGRLWFDNTVPGYLGRGLEQRHRGMVVAGALEVGVPLSFGTGWTVAPRAQLAASRIGRTAFRDELGAAVSVKRGHSGWAELGAQVERVLLQRGDRRLAWWLSGVAVREFSGGPAVDVAGETATGRRLGPAYQVDTGLRLGWAGRCSLQGAIGRVLDGERGCRGSASLTVAW